VVAVQLAFYCTGTDAIFHSYGFVAYSIGALSGEHVIEPGIAALPFAYAYAVA
jgi:hypothetical protein